VVNISYESVSTFLIYVTLFFKESKYVKTVKMISQQTMNNKEITTDADRA